MKKLLIIFGVVICLLQSLSLCFGEKDIWDKETEAKMRQVDVIMAEIKGLPDIIDEDICSKNWDSYKSHMTLLAQKIIDANMLLQDVRLVYPINLWVIYNRIAANPICGIGQYALSAFGVADVSRYSNEERMGINENDDLCLCWNIITGREELTGYYKDGACRCTYGIRNLNPNIGQIE